ncbi:MAG: biopolymer transporter ExbD [Pseudomonadota bacterium]
MRRVKRSSDRDPVISLINIVFLILIFFMVAGTLDNADRNGVTFVQTGDLECCEDGDALVITETGELRFAGDVLTEIGDYISQLSDPDPTARLLPDQNLPAQTLLETIKVLRDAGVENVVVVTEHMSS